jgi:hypothetical protein
VPLTGGDSGGATVTLASGLLFPLDVAVDSTSVYWVDCGACDGTTSNGDVRKVDLAGTTVTTIASAQVTPFAITVNSTNVFWISSGTTVETIAKP